MRKSTFIIILSVITLHVFVSCEDLVMQKTTGIKNDFQFVDLDSLLKSQVKVLNGKKLEKKVSIKGKEEKLLLVPDSTDLASDLKVFSDLNLDQAKYNGEYDIANSGNTTTFQRKGEKGPQKVTVTRNNVAQIVSIEGQYNESNMVFDSFRKYRLEFDNSSSSIRSYQFSGYQKLIFNDTVFFDIKGKFL
ncbi:hypothetical protein [Reichenbachiella sp. MALMAid0571]|uniref:hypothetical protein n=1 Tax=Reichenbachiella sp. MALMAid0571 TaxID=3143939 RepID=UPI0032DE6920